MSRSCSAVSTTEVTIPGLVTMPPLVITAPSPTCAVISRSSSASYGAGERIAALIHRRRPCVSGLAALGDPVALDAERAEHKLERYVHRLEHGALLDVQLEVGRRVLELGAASSAESRSTSKAAIAPGSGTPSASFSARRSSCRPSSRRRPTSRRERPGSGLLLVRPRDEPYGRAGGSPSSAIRRRSTSAPATTLRAAVEPAAVRHRVQVPADDERLLARTRERPPVAAGSVEALRRARASSLRRHPPRARFHVSVQATSSRAVLVAPSARAARVPRRCGRGAARGDPNPVW